MECLSVNTRIKKMGMIDVSDKSVIKREAEASGKIVLSKGTMEKIKDGSVRKGDPLVVAEIAAMNAAKQTSLLIPHCHQIALDYVKVEFNLKDTSMLEVRCFVGARARTGVEMEALVAVSIALTVIYDMCKAVDSSMILEDIRLISKEKKDIKNPEV